MGWQLPVPTRIGRPAPVPIPRPGRATRALRPQWPPPRRRPPGPQASMPSRPPPATPWRSWCGNWPSACARQTADPTARRSHLLLSRWPPACAHSCRPCWGSVWTRRAVGGGGACVWEGVAVTVGHGVRHGCPAPPTPTQPTPPTSRGQRAEHGGQAGGYGPENVPRHAGGRQAGAGRGTRRVQPPAGAGARRQERVRAGPGWDDECVGGGGGGVVGRGSGGAFPAALNAPSIA